MHTRPIIIHIVLYTRYIKGRLSFINIIIIILVTFKHRVYIIRAHTHAADVIEVDRHVTIIIVYTLSSNDRGDDGRATRVFGCFNLTIKYSTRTRTYVRKIVCLAPTGGGGRLPAPPGHQPPI